MSIRPDCPVAFSYAEALNSALDWYIHLISIGEKPEEARQVLPNACTVNLMITANLRALINFFEQRLCNRNTEEMQTFAFKMKRVCDNIMPWVFEHVGTSCFTGKCNQGAMSCKKN
jgi:thymidylate synthase (FAD)